MALTILFVPEVLLSSSLIRGLENFGYFNKSSNLGCPNFSPNNFNL